MMMQWGEYEHTVQAVKDLFQADEIDWHRATELHERLRDEMPNIPKELHDPLTPAERHLAELHEEVTELGGSIEHKDKALALEKIAKIQELASHLAETVPLE